MNFEYKFWREVSLQFLNVQVKNLLKYSSLFTYPSQLPINRAFGEVKSRLNSSPLFTTLHLCLSDNHKGGIRQIQLPGLLVLLEFDKHIRLSLLDHRECSLMGEERWRVVKSCGNSSPRQTPCLSGFARDGWRVKSIIVIILTYDTTFFFVS